MPTRVKSDLVIFTEVVAQSLGMKQITCAQIRETFWGGCQQL